MFLALLLACQPAPSPSAPAPAVHTAPLAPDALPTQLTEATGRGRLVHFWASWCQPCVAELPVWRALLDRHPGADVRMIDVDPMATQATRAIPLLQARGLDKATHLMLQSDNPIRVLAPVVPGWIGEIPHTVAVGPDGAVRGVWPRPLNEVELERALRDAETQAAPPASDG